MASERTRPLELQRQVTLARPMFVALVLAGIVATAPLPTTRAELIFAAAYMAVALGLLAAELAGRRAELRLSPAMDVAALAAFFFLSHSVVAFWFFYLFVSFAIAIQLGERTAWILGTFAVAAVVLRAGLEGDPGQRSVLQLVALALGTAAAGAASGFLGAYERRDAAEDGFLQRLVGLLQVERGLAESIRQILGEIAREFSSEQAIIAARDEDLELLFVWKARQGQSEAVSPETLPILRADAYLADNLDTTLCWNSFAGTGHGFGWQRNNGKRVKDPPHLPASSRDTLRIRSLMCATLGSPGTPTARLLVVNGRRRFTPRNLRWLEQIARRLGPPLENMFQLRHLRARAVDADRSRISRDLHDGILQTLLSLSIRVGVLRDKVFQDPKQAVEDLGDLQEIVKQEGEELRRLVTDLRPLRIESADLLELMNGFAERFRNEAGVAVDLLFEGGDLRVPDRVCRELFQIYRESLNNIKKHAQASHVVVKLWQDETKVFLVVDDNGRGFSFAGRYTSEELDRLRLGPISIKERTRSVGGALTVESSPGHGARVTIEIPLS
jgi:signal transduction histidine kinase